MKTETHTFLVRARAVPAANNRLDNLPKVAAWQQEIRAAVQEQLGIHEVEVHRGKARLGAPFFLAKGEWAEIEAYFFFKPRRGGQPDGVNCLKALEDALFGQDRELLRGTYIVERRAEEDRVRVSLTLHRKDPVQTSAGRR